MSFFDQVRLFKERRIDFPVSPEGLVLDVGSGDKPSWRANVLLDRYVDAEYANQRSGTAAAKVTRPLFDADAASMPFADHSFDYSICSNLLEHVPDPGAVIEELMRVSKAGYIEVPEAASAKIVDFPSHVWWCRRDWNGTLCFEAKNTRHFDPEVGEFLQRSGLEQKVGRVLDSQFEDRVIMLHWSGTIDYRVEGSVPNELMDAALSGPGHQKDFRARAILTATDALTFRKQRVMSRRPILFDDVIKPEHKRGLGEFLENRIYRVGAPLGNDAQCQRNQ